MIYVETYYFVQLQYRKIFICIGPPLPHWPVGMGAALPLQNLPAGAAAPTLPFDFF